MDAAFPLVLYPRQVIIRPLPFGSSLARSALASPLAWTLHGTTYRHCGGGSISPYQKLAMVQKIA